MLLKELAESVWGLPNGVSADVAQLGDGRVMGAAASVSLFLHIYVQASTTSSSICSEVPYGKR